jgi:hypothetical protein
MKSSGHREDDKDLGEDIVTVKLHGPGEPRRLGEEIIMIKSLGSRRTWKRMS